KKDNNSLMMTQEQSSQHSISRSFSAPGKALLAGGYLVLDPTYNSFVVALSARMHSVVKATASPLFENSIITVESPQFQEGEWVYEIGNLLENRGKLELIEKNNRCNPFVESTIYTILCFFDVAIGKNFESNFEIKVLIFSDAGYHSQENTVLKISDNGSKKFLYHSKPITKVAKTGLGSSAGLVTVLTASLLSVFQKNLKLNDHNDKKLIHNLSQVSHCIAQKKIGSGFDVASATFGSIVYRRFKPDLITDLISSDESKTSILEYSQRLRKVVLETDWNIVTDQCCLPPKIRLLMGDICGGSNTPKLVSKVLDWKKSNPDYALQVFTDLNHGNMELVEALATLQKISINEPAYYNDLITYLSKKSANKILNSVDNKVDISPLLMIINSISKIRHNLRLLTNETGAEIEPTQQTVLLNNCNNLIGCLGGVVPGAGGYDAICLLCVDECIPEISEQEESENEFKNVTWLDLREQKDGIIEEKIDDYIGLL
ncbi:hypothetical protein PACTADRAFT_38066, partial [Pachysolen tannophilus NRRL Y-2460]